MFGVFIIIDTALRNIWLDMTVIIELPRSLLADLNTGGTQIPERLTADFRYVDGFMYLNMDKLAALNPDATQGWYGLDFAGLFNLVLLAQPDLRDSLTLPQGAARSAAADFSGFTRIEDDHIGEQTIAVFQADVQFSDLLNDQLVRDAVVNELYNTMVSQGYLGLYGAADLRGAAANYTELLNGLSVVVQERIGEDDHYLHGLKIDILWRPDTGAMISLFSSPDPLGLAAAAFDFTIHFSLGLSGHNNVNPIPVPENPTILPLSDLLNGF